MPLDLLSWPRRGGPSRSIKRRLCLLTSLLLHLLTATTAMAELAAIQGTATYRERMALPEDAVLEVDLLDISRADASAARLASIRIKPQGQVPIPFTLHYDPALIEERFTYAVTAKILHQDRLLFRADTIHPVLTRGAGTAVEVSMVPIPAKRSEAVLPTLVGPTWVAEDIDNRGVIDSLQSHVTLTPEGRVHGSGGCNAFAGGYTLDGERLVIGTEGGQLATTLRACPDAVMHQEARFTDALGRVKSWRIENGLLVLLDAEGTPILRLWRRDT